MPIIKVIDSSKPQQQPVVTYVVCSAVEANYLFTQSILRASTIKAIPVNRIGD